MEPLGSPAQRDWLRELGAGCGKLALVFQPSLRFPRGSLAAHRGIYRFRPL